MSKLRIFVQTYTPASPQRNAELKRCLDGNSAQYEVIKVNRQERITFREWFSIINEHASDDDISVLTNSDILFDATLSNAHNIKQDECYALVRWQKGEPLTTGADTWIFRGKIKTIEDCDFGLGIADCDYAIAERLTRAGYMLRNPCYDIVGQHVHDSNLRTYYGMAKIGGPHRKTCPPTRIADHGKIVKVWTVVSESHEHYLADYLAPSIPQGVHHEVRRVPQHCTSGVYLTDGWKTQMAEKLKVMIEMAETCDMFVFLDADVKLRDQCALDAMIFELGDNDIVFQRDRIMACAGVFIGRGNERTVALFKAALSVLDKHGCDQPAINASLKTVPIKWGYLSSAFWNFSFFAASEWDGKLKFTIPQDAILVHGNWAKGRERKRAILDMA
jgi:hypothetical protein